MWHQKSVSSQNLEHFLITERIEVATKNWLIISELPHTQMYSRPRKWNTPICLMIYYFLLWHPILVHQCWHCILLLFWDSSWLNSIRGEVGTWESAIHRARLLVHLSQFCLYYLEVDLHGFRKVFPNSTWRFQNWTFCSAGKTYTVPRNYGPVPESRKKRKGRDEWTLWHSSSLNREISLAQVDLSWSMQVDLSQAGSKRGHAMACCRPPILPIPISIAALPAPFHPLSPASNLPGMAGVPATTCASRKTPAFLPVHQLRTLLQSTLRCFRNSTCWWNVHSSRAPLS